MIWLDLCWGVPIKRDSGVFQSIQVSLVLQLLAAGEAENLQAMLKTGKPQEYSWESHSSEQAKNF